MLSETGAPRSRLSSAAAEVQVAPESEVDAEDISMATWSQRDQPGAISHHLGSVEEQPGVSESVSSNTNRLQLVASSAEQFYMLHLFYRSSSMNETPGER